MRNGITLVHLLLCSSLAFAAERTPVGAAARRHAVATHRSAKTTSAADLKAATLAAQLRYQKLQAKAVAASEAAQRALEKVRGLEGQHWRALDLEAKAKLRQAAATGRRYRDPGRNAINETLRDFGFESYIPDKHWKGLKSRTGVLLHFEQQKLLYTDPWHGRIYNGRGLWLRSDGKLVLGEGESSSVADPQLKQEIKTVTAAEALREFPASAEAIKARVEARLLSDASLLSRGY